MQTRTMKTGIMTAVSALALMMAAPAMADDKNNKDVPEVQEVTKEDVKETWGETKENVKVAVDDTSDMMERFAADVKALFSDGQEGQIGINHKRTAAVLLDKNIEDAGGKNLGRIEDIIIDGNGDARRIVFEKGGILGLGGDKMVIAYDDVMKHSEYGDVLTPVSPEELDKLATKYNEAEIMEPGFTTVSRILEGKVIGPDGKTLGKVANATLRDADVTHLLVVFDATLGFGGDEIAMDYDKLGTRTRNGVQDFILNDAQTEAFAKYKSTSIN